MNTMPEGGMTPPPRGWWSRNWKWVVPVGCLGMMASCGCLGALIVGLTFSALKSSEAYVKALLVATSDPEVQEALGPDIEPSWQLQGKIETKNGTDHASFTVPLAGSRADGTLRVEAIKVDDTLRFSTFQVEVPGRPPIDLRSRMGGETQRELLPAPDAPPDEAGPPAGGDTEPAGGSDEEQ